MPFELEMCLAGWPAPHPVRGLCRDLHVLQLLFRDFQKLLSFIGCPTNFSVRTYQAELLVHRGFYSLARE